ncbi:ABC transporter permease [Paenibacillus lignilyticus]|uniref:ABC-2 family transporter protein n=1 Tax=Paenibacillus lignilyticus TaxID=1172615 RepID=A0ABS5CD71_9BACL|nr:ABC-2 family transporter protein [Paenibacillus lignilyticus]MBP3963941.1 ABC-2 family transporter protein [Paenibacillus lignilyticus]
MRLALYREMTLNSLRQNMAYRMEVFMFLFGQLIKVFVQVYIWYAVFAGQAKVDSGAGSISVKEMVTYVVISSFISVFATNNVIFWVGRKVRNGEIAMELLKPVNFRFAAFFHSLGQNVYRVFFELLPLLVISLCFFRIELPTGWQAVAFVIMLFNAFLLNFLINYIIGLIAFWYVLVWQINVLLSGLIRLFSGAFIPIWFFSGMLTTISYCLPFRLIYYDPISVYLGKTSGLNDVGFVILQQVGWIVALLLLERRMWASAVKKLVVQGG